jgi:hypothetical protein
MEKDPPVRPGVYSELCNWLFSYDEREETEMASDHQKRDALLDELLKDYTDPQDILGEHGLLRLLTKRVVERALEAELTAHLG